MSYQIYKHSLVWDGEPHQEKRLSKMEAKRLLQVNRAWLLTNTYDFDCREQTTFWYIIKDQFGGTKELNGNARRDVMKSLRSCETKLIDKQILVEQGYEVYLSAFKNYRRIGSPPDTEEAFLKELQVDRPGEEYWGCLDKGNGKLIGYFRTEVRGNMCRYLSGKAKPEYLHTDHRPFYGMFYVMNEYYLDTLRLSYVSDGFRTISEHSNVQSFLVRNFNFRKAYCRLSVFYNRQLKAFTTLFFPFRRLIPSQSIQSLFRLEAISRGLE